MNQNSHRKNNPDRHIKKQTGKNSSQRSRCQTPESASAKMQKPSHKSEKHVIHQEIRQKNDIYVYGLIHKIPPLPPNTLSVINPSLW